ncbi:MAG TPA: hypothetical protein VE222_10110 [Nitrospiraceae bacterium]|nr:hypothetical protein [Nitrospiraceae bacterium]
MAKVYKGDATALATVFRFGTTFDVMDSHAKAYGNLMFSTFLNIMESRGEEIFVKALNLLSDDEKQRTRDFFYYPVHILPKPDRERQEKDAREQFPHLFPPEYEFGKNDKLFK